MHDERINCDNLKWARESERNWKKIGNGKKEGKHLARDMRAVC